MRDSASKSERLLELLTDPETSLLTPEFFLLRLQEEFKKSWRHGWPAALLLVEVEGLERIASQEGAAAHRSSLLDITGEILSASRDTDLSTRLSPGRFAILLAGAQEGGARAFVERVVRRIIDGSFGRLVLYMGGALSPGDSTSADQLVSRAEDALARARDEGPNGFVML